MENQSDPARLVDFDGQPRVPIDEIVAIIEGYFAGDPLTERIIVVMANGGTLHLNATASNRAAAARWRFARAAPRHSG